MNKRDISLLLSCGGSFVFMKKSNYRFIKMIRKTTKIKFQKNLRKCAWFVDFGTSTLDTQVEPTLLKI